jgi:hypothetical protein
VTSVFARRRHPESLVYVVLVLWLIGHAERAIAAAAGLRRKQVSGIVHNSEYRNRAGMTDVERAERLGELRAIRFGDDGRPLDGGALDRFDWSVRPLGARQARGPLRRRLTRHG